MGKIYALVNQKGGVGKTTSAVNLAALLGAAGRRTVLVDLDPLGNAASGCGVSQARGCAEVLAGRGVIEEAACSTAVPGLALLPPGQHLGAWLQDHPDLAVTRTRELLTECKAKFELVFVDAAPGATPFHIALAAQADYLLVPCPPEPFPEQSLNALAAAIERSSKTLQWLAFRTLVNGTTVREAPEMAGTVRIRWMKTQVPRDTWVPIAQEAGKPLFLVAPFAKATHAYMSIAKEVTTNEGEAAR